MPFLASYNIQLVLLQSLKKIVRVDPEIINYIIMTQNGPKLAIWLKQILFGKFKTYHFCPLIIQGYAAKLKNNPSGGS